uniref:Uncharacterized protein n=1 Tax=Cacopsylla melanoneura TaxID=428564 RepID=A0A8D9BNT4_9HEMI
MCSLFYTRLGGRGPSGGTSTSISALLSYDLHPNFKVGSHYMAERHIIWQYAMVTTGRLVYVKGEYIEHFLPNFLASCECHILAVPNMYFCSCTRENKWPCTIIV